MNKKLLIVSLMFLVMMIPAFAYVSQQAYSRDTLTTNTTYDCHVFNVSSSNCKVYQDFITIDYKSNTDFRIGTKSGWTSDNEGRGSYVAYIKVDVNAYAVEGERFFGRVNKTVEKCVLYDTTLNGTLKTFYNQTQYGNETFSDYIRIELRDNQYARCEMNTYYIDRTLFLTNTPILWKLWKPTYKSTTQEPCKIALLKKQAEYEVCQDAQIGTAIADKELVKLALKRFLNINYNLLVWIFWIFVIAVLIFVIMLIIGVPFVLIKGAKKLMKKIRR